MEAACSEQVASRFAYKYSHIPLVICAWWQLATRLWAVRSLRLFSSVQPADRDQREKRLVNELCEA